MPHISFLFFVGRSMTGFLILLALAGLIAVAIWERNS